jgi:hypothetical protein
MCCVGLCFNKHSHMFRSGTHMLLAASSHIACLNENDDEIIRIINRPAAVVSVDLTTALEACSYS